ncbi:hypothetical protein BCV71DRAFT_167648, partial [Rhizopus microsporus]
VFNAIYKKYFWGSESTALKLRIPFLNARLIQMNEPENTVDIIRKLKKKHGQHSLRIVLSGDTNGQAPLSQLVSFEIKKPLKSSGCGVLLLEEK